MDKYRGNRKNAIQELQQLLARMTVTKLENLKEKHRINSLYEQLQKTTGLNKNAIQVIYDAAEKKMNEELNASTQSMNTLYTELENLKVTSEN